jgi:hypothetical protein
MPLLRHPLVLIRGFQFLLPIGKNAGMFKPGVSGNPKGRAPGTRNRKTLAAGQAIDAAATKDKNGRKVVDPRDLLTSIVSSTETNPALRISAATALLPYLYLRKTARYIDRTIELPVPQSVEEAAANIARLASLAAEKVIGLDEMESLVNAQRAYVEVRIGLDVENRMTELRELVERVAASARPVDAVISGGLPRMPGHEDVLLPVFAPPTNGGEPEDAS